MILNKMFWFSWHLLISKIHKIFFFFLNKGWVIKHIKAPARVKAELPDLWNNIVFSNTFVKQYSVFKYLVLRLRHRLEYHYNIVKIYFTKIAIPNHHTFFLSQVNLSMSRDQFWSLLILCKKSAKNLTSQKLKCPSPQTCYIASQCDKWKKFSIHTFLKTTFMIIGPG